MTESLAIVPRSVPELEALSERLAKSTLLPAAMRDKMPNVLVTIMAGQELGLSPMASLRSVHVIEGKPVLAADAMVAIVLGSGKCEYFTRIEESDTAVTYETRRKGDPHPRRCTWTMEMAKKAALNAKDNWRGYPRAMLASRAKSELARDVYPDVLAGCYTHDEIDDIGRTPSAGPPPTVRHTDAIDVDVVDVPAEEPAWGKAIDDAPNEEALKALAPSLADLPKGEKERAKKRYGNRLGWLRRNGGSAPPTVPDAIDVDPDPAQPTSTEPAP